MAPGPIPAKSDPTAPLPFTRKEFYDLAESCRAYATELAGHEQRHIRVAECRRMNGWLREIKRYERLGPRIAPIRPARPIARWQVATLTGVLWAIVYLYAATRGERVLALVMLNSALFVLLAFYMLPERLFGTTIEGLEGKLLRVVETLEQMLASEEMGFSEAAHFQVRDNLAAAHAELRLQIDLAHRES